VLGESWGVRGRVWVEKRREWIISTFGILYHGAQWWNEGRLWREEASGWNLETRSSCIVCTNGGKTTKQRGPEDEARAMALKELSYELTIQLRAYRLIMSSSP